MKITHIFLRNLTFLYIPTFSYWEIVYLVSRKKDKIEEEEVNTQIEDWK